MQSLAGDSRRPDITFHADGRIIITARVALMLGMQPGDVIDIVAPGDGEYYLTVRYEASQSSGRHAGTVLATNKSGNTMRAHSSTLSRQILTITGQSGVVRLTVGEPITLAARPAVPIITRKILNG